MRRFFFYLAVVILAFSGCSNQTQNESETDFFRNFSLGQVVELMKVPELKPSSGGSGGSTTHGETVRSQRDFNLIYTIEDREGAKFDETIFMSKLKDQVGRSIGDSKVHIDGGGSSNDSFYFDFSKERHEGWLQVVGARVEGNRYKLWGVIRERTQK